MAKQVFLLSALFAVVIVAVFVLIWVLVDWILEKRRMKLAKKANEEWVRQQQAEQADAGPEVARADYFLTYVGITQEAVAHTEIIQARTKVGSREEVLENAMDFYTKIFEKYSDGYRLAFFRKSDKKICGVVKFDPLDRVGQKMES